MSWYRRLINLMRSDQLAHDIEREMAFHLAERVDELVAQSMSRADARREARRRFGNRAVLRERVHDVDVVVWLESLLADLRYAARALRAQPAFTLVAVSGPGLPFTTLNAVTARAVPPAAATATRA